MQAEQLIEKCIHSLKEQGVDVKEEAFIAGNESTSKGTLTLKGVAFHYVVLKEVRPQQVFQLREEYQKDAHSLLMAHYITPKAKEALKNAGINYIESNGNAFIQSGGTFILIDKHRSRPPEQTKPGQAFTKTGLKVTFQFLCDPDLLKSTYRIIAGHAGVALGSLTKVMNRLKQDGYLLITQTGWEITNYETLLQKWIDAYQEKLQPDLFIQRYTPVKKDFFEEWQNWVLPLGNQWGGEPAGALLTQYLKPAVFTIYTEKPVNQLVRDFHWKPDPEGPITVYRKFWKSWTDNNPYVPFLLIYADLINTHDARCLETAQKIYEQYVKPIALRTL